MATGRLTGLIQSIRKVVLRHPTESLTDAALLERFLANRDEAAFEAIVRRHGPMVFGVCRRVLWNVHDVEDAFQATFLVLVRRTASIRQREAVGNWLYGVAYRIALAARRANVRQSAKQKQVKEMPEPQATLEDTWQDLQPLLDQELNRLPDKYRLPVVLCDLEGGTRKEVARQLRIPEGTLSNRLATGRRMLAKRLARHGIALSGGAVATIVVSHSAASACVPTSLVVSTVKAAASIAAGNAVATATVSANAAALTEGMVKAMFMSKLKFATAVLVMLAALATGAAALTQQVLASKPVDQPVQSKNAPADKPQAKQGDKPEFTVTWKERAVLRGHENEVVSVAFAGKALLTGGKDAKILVWDPAKGELIKPKDVSLWKTHPVDFIAALPDGDKIAVSCTTPEGLCINSYGTVSKGVGAGFSTKVLSAAQDIKARGLAIASDGKTWALVIDGQKKPRQEPFPPILNGLPPFEGEHDGNISAAAFSPDNATLATASEDKTVKLWDCGTRKDRATCKGPTQPLVCVAFAPDGKTVAAGSTDGTVWVWDATTAKQVATLRDHEGIVNCLTFTPNGKVLATGGDDKTVALWDVASAKRLTVLKGHTGAVRSVAFSRDGGILASGGQDKEVRLWEQAK